jgi:membrane protease YdiL (CAAX protease family)
MGVFAGISALVYSLLGGEFVSTGIPLVVFLVILLGTLTINGGIEEFGWRGYLLPRLQQRWSPIVASLIVGVAWALWHLPMYVVPGAVYYGQPFWLFGSLVVLMSFWYTWLYNASNGRILPVVFLHGLHNAATVLYPFAPESMIVAVAPAIVAYVTVSVGLVVLTKGRLAGPKGPVYLESASPASAEANVTPT